MGLLDRLLGKKGRPSFSELKTIAENGDAEAQCKIGLAHADVDGTPQNFEEAYRWFRRAADQGHAQAQFYVGAFAPACGYVGFREPQIIS